MVLRIAHDTYASALDLATDLAARAVEDENHAHTLADQQTAADVARLRHVQVELDPYHGVAMHGNTFHAGDYITPAYLFLFPDPPAR